MKILLLRLKTCWSKNEASMGQGVGILGTILTNQGHQVDIIDDNSIYKKYSEKEILQKAIHYNIVGLSITIYNAIPSYSIAERLKASHPSIITIAGGIHMQHCAAEALEHGMDYAIPGDGEIAIPRLISAIRTLLPSNEIEKIPGVALKLPNGKIKLPSNNPKVDTLESIPFINYDLFNFRDFYKNGNELNSFQINGQRGCPFSCTFCSSAFRQEDKRFACAEHMFKHVKHLHERYNINYIFFTDNNFTYPRQRAIDLCQKIIDSGLNKKITFTIQTQVNTPLDSELLETMKEAGISKLCLGLERLEETSMKNVNKYTPAHKIQDIARRIVTSGIDCYSFVLIGFPFDTPKVLKKEQDAFTQIHKYVRFFSIAVLLPLPGTIYHDMLPAHSKKWYLSKKFQSYLLKRDTYYAFICESTENDDIDFNHFDFDKETKKTMRKFVQHFHKLNNNVYLKERSIIHRAILMIIRVLQFSSLFCFKISPRLEAMIFGRIKSLHHYLGTLFFSRQVISTRINDQSR